MKSPTSTANHFEHYSGIGLDNIDQRIKLLYGEKYGLTVESRINEGTTVRLLADPAGGIRVISFH